MYDWITLFTHESITSTCENKSNQPHGICTGCVVKCVKECVSRLFAFLLFKNANDKCGKS